MKEVERTERGFAIFGRVPTANGGSVRVQESSIAFEGAHCWLFLDGERCSDHHLHGHQKPDPHLNVAQAKQLREALDAFITAAEADELTEPAEVDDASDD